MDSIWRKTFSSSELSAEEEAEMELGGYCRFVLGGGRRAGFGQLLDVSVNVLEEFQHTELVHGDDKGSFDVVMISVVPRREKERGDIPERRGRRQEFWRKACLRA
jgi:hypothetical protein